MDPWKNKIMRCWPHRIWQQILGVLIILVTVPLLVLGAVLIATSQEAVKTTVLRGHRELAVRAAGEISGFVQKPRELLTTVAAIIGVGHADPWRQETAIVELALRYPMFRRIASVNFEGQEAAISTLGGERRDRRSDPAFLSARDGKCFFSSIQVHDNDTPVADIAVPVTQWGRTTGVLIAEVDLRGMWDIADEIRIGASGYACVIDGAGRVIAHPDKKIILGRESMAENPLASGILTAEESGSAERTDKDGRRWLVAHADIKEVGWKILIIQSADEAYAVSRVMRWQAWGFVAFGIFVAFLISLALARFMGQPLNMLLDGVRRIARKDFDQPLPVGRDDEIGQILGSFNEMTLQLKQMEQKEKLTAIGKASMSIAHELKNSLTLVDMYMQLLTKHQKDREFMREFVRIVPRELKAWKGMLMNMVDYARSSKFVMGAVDLSELMEDMAIMARVRVEQKDIGLSVDVMPGLPPVMGNAEKLRQVLLNLITNAFEAVPSGGNVRLAAYVDKPRDPAEPVFVVIQIDNTGSVIPAEKVDKMFEPFETTKDGGLGLGLAICREIVDKHNGFIHVISTPGEGTSFRLRLPVADNGSGKR